MCRQNKKQNREIIPSYLYEKLKKEMAIIAAERGKSRIWITNGIEDKFIDKNSEIPSGWGRGRTLTKDITKIDIYKKEKNSLIFVFTADSTYDALQFINKNSNKLILGRSLKGRCENAKNGQGSKAGDFYICYHEGYPIIKTANSLPGSATAAKVNRGKKRPEHSKIMKEYFLKKDKKNIYYFIHITGLEFIGSRRDLMDKFIDHKISNSELGAMINGNYKTHRGWSLKINSMSPKDSQI